MENSKEEDPIYLSALYDVLDRLGGDGHNKNSYKELIDAILGMVEIHEFMRSREECRKLRRSAARLALQKNLIELAEDILELELPKEE